MIFIIVFLAWKKAPVKIFRYFSILPVENKCEWKILKIDKKVGVKIVFCAWKFHENPTRKKITRTCEKYENSTSPWKEKNVYFKDLEEKPHLPNTIYYFQYFFWPEYCLAFEIWRFNFFLCLWYHNMDYHHGPGCHMFSDYFIW